jgi:hypothetical protein
MSARWLIVAIALVLISTSVALAAVLNESESSPSGITARLTTSPALPVVNASTTLAIKTSGLQSAQLVGVRSDLQDFFHLTPKRVAGELTATHRFPHPGLYQLWSGATTLWFKHPVVIVGTGPSARPVINLSRYDVVGLTRVSLVASSTLLASQPFSFKVNIGLFASTTPPLVATAIKSDLSFIAQASTKTGMFSLTFPEAGYYKLFVEWGDNNLASFWLKVSATSIGEATVSGGLAQRIWRIFSPSQ